MSSETLPALHRTRAPWNKGRIVGQKRPLLPKHVWSIRVRLEMADNKRDLALFNMAIDCKLRGCDLVCLKVNDVYAAGRVKERASVTQSKTRKPVRFGFSRSAWNRAPMAPIRCDAPRLPRYTRKQATFALFNFCSGIPKWTVRCVISALTWMMRCPCLKGSTCKLFLADSYRPGMSPRATIRLTLGHMSLTATS